MLKRLAGFVGAFVCLGTCAIAGPPHDLWGYYPGQTLVDALAVDTTRQVADCDFKTEARCITFKLAYLVHSTEVNVIVKGEKIDHVIFTIVTGLGLEKADCERNGAAIVAAATELYGAPTEAKPSEMLVHTAWREGKLDYALTALCVPSKKGTIGLVSGHLMIKE